MNSIFLRTLFGACCFIMLLVSCETDTTAVVGEDWISNGTKVFFIDTFTVESSTYKFDSLPVSGTNKYLLGAYTDPVFGHVKASTYIELYTDNFYIDDDAVYDSVALLLDYTGYYYNDTIPKQKYNVYQVLESLTPPEDYFYNTTSFLTSTTSIGNLEISPKPNKSDSIQFTLNNSFGKQLFDDIQDDEINNLDELTQKYYGIKVEADDDNTTVLGIGTSSILRLYYKLKGEVEDVEAYYDFTINTTNSFHSVTEKFSNDDLTDLTLQSDEVSSKQTDNTSYIQAGVGLATRINIPYIESINSLNGSGSIMDANLKVSIKQNSNTDNLSVRDSLNVYIIDQKNEIVTQLVDYTGNLVYGLQINDEFGDGYITYNIALKYFLDLKLNTINSDFLFLGIMSQDFNESVDRYILEGEESENSKLKTTLELNYALYNDE
ncbi:DUF4270 family protein [Formosa sp. PL04]|uniref:DUF4270 family protein n=1 Tax=Formosa sp. PL04 TaxID=3081755 RepID=UPI002981CD43|nr:DUF4270 family protein [Formosa sp. PL04]MDW5288687.1 DUF4270 family protein [Formosa sp. PL04]